MLRMIAADRVNTEINEFFWGLGAVIGCVVPSSSIWAQLIYTVGSTQQLLGIGSLFCNLIDFTSDRVWLRVPCSTN